MDGKTHQLRRSRGGWVLALCLVAAFPPVWATWCDLYFVDIMGTADIVVLADYHPESGGEAGLHVVRVYRGAMRVGTSLGVNPVHLSEFQPREGQQFVLALRRNRQLLLGAEGMGVCDANSVLPIRGGKLRGRDREHYYDGERKALTLDQLEQELTQQFAQR